MMGSRFPFYLLSDSPDGMKKEAEVTGRTPPPHRTDDDVKKGFVYRRVPHVPLKAIANNEEIDHIHDKWQQQIEPLREKLNKARKQAWEEWEVPREPGEDWSQADQKLLAEWWELRRKRQQEIDDSIARNADQELLYDQPYEDKSIVRVTGPFTVESLSPHRQLSVAQKKQRADGVDGLSVRVIGPDQFGTMIFDNLRKAGIQNRVKDERLKFDALEPWPGSGFTPSASTPTKPATSAKSRSASARNTARSARDWSRKSRKRPSKASAMTCWSSAVSRSIPMSTKKPRATASWKSRCAA